MLIKPLSWMHGAHDGQAITAHGIRVGISVEIQKCK